MANTMIKIASVTVGASGQSSIEFTSIPQTFTDLKVVYSLRCANASSRSEGFNLKLGNNTIDTGSNYSLRYLQGSGSAASSGSLSSQTSIYIGEMNGQTSTASVFNNGEIYIPNYTSSNNKSVSVDNVQEDNQTGAYQHLIAGLWSNSSAINIVRISGTNNLSQYSTATLYGISSDLGKKAAGGQQIYSDANYWYHVYTNTSASYTFTPTQQLTVDYLVVAGGGSGGCRPASNYPAGGGGAGGVRCTVGATGGGGSLESPLTLNANTAYTVTVGAGGTGVSTDSNGNAGSNSVFATITSTGGGYGARVGTSGGSGGSGGGAAGSDNSPAGSSSNFGANGGSASPSGQGYAGGAGWSDPSTGTNRSGGGGGGAGAAGTNGTSGTGGAGGNGITTSISGTSTTYGGGGGGVRPGGAAGSAAGGTGGGGAGNGGGSATSGTANTGGGGGASYSGTSGSGGSGIVIIRYAK